MNTRIQKRNNMRGKNTRKKNNRIGMGMKANQPVVKEKKPVKKMKSKTGKKKPNTAKNGSLIGKMPKVEDTKSDIKLSKIGLQKVIKSVFTGTDMDEQQLVRLLKELGKDEQSVQNLTKFVNTLKEKDLKKKADIIRNMNQMKDSILTIYKLFDELNNNLGELFERKNPQKN